MRPVNSAKDVTLSQPVRNHLSNTTFGARTTPAQMTSAAGHSEHTIRSYLTVSCVSGMYSSRLSSSRRLSASSTSLGAKFSSSRTCKQKQRVKNSHRYHREAATIHTLTALDPRRKHARTSQWPLRTASTSAPSWNASRPADMQRDE
jgi:hypothetical protein